MKIYQENVVAVIVDARRGTTEMKGKEEGEEKERNAFYTLSTKNRYAAELNSDFLDVRVLQLLDVTGT